MPVVSNKIHRAKKIYECDDCGAKIDVGEEYNRLFGSAFEGDPMFEIKLCMNCVERWGKNNAATRTENMA